MIFFMVMLYVTSPLQTWKQYSYIKEPGKDPSGYETVIIDYPYSNRDFILLHGKRQRSVYIKARSKYDPSAD